MDKKAIRLTVGAGLGLVSVSLGFIPRQETGTTTVTGKNDPAVDFAAVQNAVDNYDRVILRETFDFGAEGSVHIARSVELEGEVEAGPDSGRTWITSIKGGFEPIRIRNAAGGKVTIRDLELDGALGTAILYLEGSDLEVSRVRIANVFPGHVLREFPSDRLRNPNGITGRIGIIAYDWDGENERPGGKISGRIYIHDCVLDLSEPPSSYSRVIATVGGDADIAISGNEITDLGKGNNIGVEVFLGGRVVTMERNHVVARRALLTVFGNYGPVHIRHNTGEVLDETQRSLGAVWVSSHSDDAGEITDNNFRLHNSAVGIMTGFDGANPAVTGPIRIPYRDGEIKDNTLTGTIHREEDEVHGAIVFLYESHDNVAKANDLSGLVFSDDGSRAPSYHLLPSTSGNTVLPMDAAEIVKDEGTDNRIVH